MKEWYIKNRQKLAAALEEDFTAIFFSGRAPKKEGDELYPFSPERNFLYLTGIDAQGAALVLCRTGNEVHESLYIEKSRGEMAKWIGEGITPEESREISGIEDVRETPALFADLSERLSAPEKPAFYTEFAGRDTENYKSDSALLRERFPETEPRDVSGIMGELRLVKEHWEIQEIKNAVEITREGFEAMMKNARSGMYEYEIESYFDFVLKKNGVFCKAFDTIAASGPKGTILHYSRNDRRAEEGELILLDAGASSGYYKADITRTFPVSGRFTARQRLIYDGVLEGNKKVISAVVPGLEFRRLNEILLEYYFEFLKGLGLANSREEVRRYYYHGVSHYLGLETHDAGRRDGILAPGMVITVEPGLYIEEWGIGVRIEDDVLVTESGAEVLSSGIIKEPDEIEAFMAEGRRDGETWL